jgi:hypothetical protein
VCTSHALSALHALASFPPSSGMLISQLHTSIRLPLISMNLPAKSSTSVQALSQACLFPCKPDAGSVDGRVGKAAGASTKTRR